MDVGHISRMSPIRVARRALLVPAVKSLLLSTFPEALTWEQLTEKAAYDGNYLHTEFDEYVAGLRAADLWQ